jgi:serine/threonine protein kinase
MYGDELEARIGMVLRNKWTLEKLLGSGGMAGVYLARHKIGRTAAVKLLHPEIALDANVLARFEQEAMAVNEVGHPGVVEVIDVDVTDDGIHYLVMELLDGETLADRYERDPDIKLPFLLDVTDQLLDVLVACHGKGIIHRDVKPENLFLQKDGKLKVLDFGIARVHEGLRTEAGTMLGTIAFSSPEQLKGSKVDHRADLFSVGATLFTLLARRRVHEPVDQANFAVMMLSKAAPPLAEVSEGIPDNVCMFVDRALAYLPDRRYPDARTMRGDVWAVQKGQRPPYANACHQTGMDPHVTVEPSTPPQPTREEGAKLKPMMPSTEPQMPVFADAAEPQSEAAEPALLPSTDPQLPAFLDGEAEDDTAAADGPADETPAKRKPAREPTKRGGLKSHKQWQTDPSWPIAPADDTADGDDD